ncbi:MAG: TetR/AcrR family transcriptional regulator [Firmicutes bacterium]|nr:TetR/AcrR family transcriptional regulator [Bacillota bacterium]
MLKKKIKLTKRDMESRAKRKLIYEKAFELFKIFGYDNTTIADICQAAGVSVGSLYHFYRSKESLLLEISNKLGNTYIPVDASEENLRSPYEPILNYLLDYSQEFEKLGVDLTTQIYRVFERAYVDVEKGTIQPLRAYTTLGSFISAAQEYGSLDKSMPADDIVAYFITISRGLVYEWCLWNGTYSLREKASRFLPRIIKTFLIEK